MVDRRRSPSPRRRCRPGDFPVRHPTNLLACVNRRFRSDQPSCAARGSSAIADAIEAGIRVRRIALDFERIRCLGQCDRGPALRLAPGGRFFLGVTLEDVARLLDEMEAEFGTRAPSGPGRDQKPK